MTAEKKESLGLRLARILVGIVFVVAGIGKLLLPLITPLVMPGAPSFADVLAQIGVPFPSIAAPVVCVVEIVGGLAMLSGNKLAMPLAGLALAGDMIGALVSLSIPAHLGHPAHFGALELGNEPWRLPLELSMLFGAIAIGRPWTLLRILRKR